MVGLEVDASPKPESLMNLHSLMSGPLVFGLTSGFTPGHTSGLKPGLASGFVPGLASGLVPRVVPGLLLGFVVGLLAGFIHFTTLHWSVRLLTSGTIAKALVVQLCRLGLLAAVFIVLARLGAPTLLSAAVGLLLARHLILRRVRSHA
jgi:F1F0 ATPase subunit 2